MPRRETLSTNESADFRLAALVVAYHPEGRAFSELLHAVSTQTDAIVVVDNTPGGARCLQPASDDADMVTIIRNGRNLGLGSAQNQAIHWAMTRGFTHVLILDQDSIPAADCVTRLRNALRGLEAEG